MHFNDSIEVSFGLLKSPCMETGLAHVEYVVGITGYLLQKSGLIGFLNILDAERYEAWSASEFAATDLELRGAVPSPGTTPGTTR